MNIDEYIRRLMECDPQNLKDELGVYDNFPVYVTTRRDISPFDEMVMIGNLLEKSGLYARNSGSEFQEDRRAFRKNGMNLGLVQVLGREPTYVPYDIDEEKIYTSQLFLHPYGDGGSPADMGHAGMEAVRALILDVHNISRENGISLCFPKKPGPVYLE